MNRAALTLSVTIAAFATAAPAQVNEWASSNGNWWAASSWDLGHAPIAGESVQINNNATVFFTTGITPDLTNVSLGADNPISNGVLDVSGGRLNTNHLDVGANQDGTMFVSGSAIVTVSGTAVIGSNTSATGTMVIDGGETNVSSTLLVGNAGEGTLEVLSGTLNTSGLTAGNSSSSSAILNFQGGIVNCAGSNMSFGNMGSAIVTIGECDITAGSILSGNGATGTGTTSMSGGSVLTSNIRLSGAGATWTQTAGDVWASAYVRLGGVGTGVYNLEGGTLKTSSVQQGSPLFEFNMSGGTLSFSGFGQPAEPMDLNPTGGTISPGFLGTYVDAIVYGNLSIPAGVGLEIDLAPPWPFLNDSIAANGTVTLGGDLTLQLNIAPEPDDVVVIVDNDGADPIVGTFAGLTEGSTITAFVGVNPYDFVISYVGGDGNDVTLSHPDCPPDLNGDGILDGADIAAFITFFLGGSLAADFNGDGILDGGDIAEFIDQFLAGC